MGGRRTGMGKAVCGAQYAPQYVQSFKVTKVTAELGVEGGERQDRVRGMSGAEARDAGSSWKERPAEDGRGAPDDRGWRRRGSRGNPKREQHRITTYVPRGTISQGRAGGAGEGEANVGAASGTLPHKSQTKYSYSDF